MMFFIKFIRMANSSNLDFVEKQLKFIRDEITEKQSELQKLRDVQLQLYVEKELIKKNTFVENHYGSLPTEDYTVIFYDSDLKNKYIWKSKNESNPLRGFEYDEDEKFSTPSVYFKSFPNAQVGVYLDRLIERYDYLVCVKYYYEGNLIYSTGILSQLSL